MAVFFRRVPCSFAIACRLALVELTKTGCRRARCWFHEGLHFRCSQRLSICSYTSTQARVTVWDFASLAQDDLSPHPPAVVSMGHAPDLGGGRPSRQLGLNGAPMRGRGPHRETPRAYLRDPRKPRPTPEAPRAPAGRFRAPERPRARLTSGVRYDLPDSPRSGRVRRRGRTGRRGW